MHKLAVRCVAHLKKEQDALKGGGNQENFEKTCVRYYHLAVKYCLNKENKEELQRAFIYELDNMDIEELSSKYSILGYKVSQIDPVKKVRSERFTLNEEDMDPIDNDSME